MQLGEYNLPGLPDMPDLPAAEARENLRVIRSLMERSTRHSTFLGLSGVLVGLICLGGIAAQRLIVDTAVHPGRTFLLVWCSVIASALVADYLLTKRVAAQVGKTILSRLGRQMALAALPGLGTGALLTLFLLRFGQMYAVFPFWMLAYGTAVCSVGLFSQREVGRLGWAFIAAGAVALGLFVLLPVSAVHGAVLIVTAIALGGFHVVYGIVVARRTGW